MDECQAARQRLYDIDQAVVLLSRQTGLQLALPTGGIFVGEVQPENQCRDIGFSSQEDVSNLYSAAVGIESMGRGEEKE